jgi:hypothetical protein
MAQMFQLLMVDDIDGQTAQETVRFSLDGVAYEIDLTEDNAARMRESFAEWIGSARRAEAGGHDESRAARPVRAHRSSSTPPSDARAVRDWAEEQGLPVSERGRISARVREAYAAAH